MEKNLVLTGVNYEQDNLKSQMVNALRKFVGRNMFSEDEAGIEDSTCLTTDNLEQVFFSKEKLDIQRRKGCQVLQVCVQS